jgi:hypothetical protein
MEKLFEVVPLQEQAGRVNDPDDIQVVSLCDLIQGSSSFHNSGDLNSEIDSSRR